MNDKENKFAIEITRTPETEDMRELLTISVNGTICCYEVPIEMARKTLLEWIGLSSEWE